MEKITKIKKSQNLKKNRQYWKKSPKLRKVVKIKKKKSSILRKKKQYKEKSSKLTKEMKIVKI